MHRFRLWTLDDREASVAADEHVLGMLLHAALATALAGFDFFLRVEAGGGTGDAHGVLDLLLDFLFLFVEFFFLLFSEVFIVPKTILVNATFI